MSFSILYHEASDLNANLCSIAVYIDSFAKRLGIEQLQISTEKLYQVAGALTKPDFPHVDGIDKASPFKKAANFFVWFVGANPVLDELPAAIVGPDLNSIPNHQNVIFAYHLAVDSLHGAVIHRPDGSTVRLENRIKISKHFFRDFVEAFSAAVPAYHFKIVSLLFEQLAYKDNRNASYPEVV